MAADMFTDLPRATDANGDTLTGATWSFYASGTSTPQAVYSNATLATSLGAVVTADSGGMFVPIYLDPALSYRAVLKDFDGATVREIDPCNTGVFSALAASTGATLIGTSYGLTVAEVLALSQPADSLYYYGYVGDGTSNPLSGVTLFKGVNTTGWTLGQWQTAVPQVTALTNEIDSIAVQAWYNDRPNGGAVTIPAGVGVWNTTVNTGLNQGVELRGMGRDMTEIKWFSTGTLWKHGFTGSTGANKMFSARDFRVTPANDTASDCCFNVRFSGDQAPWCHIVENVLVLARDTTSWFTNATITRNIKRGLDWRNFNVFGRNFFILSTDAHVFPSNVSIDPDCPPGQANTDAGDSYNFDNCMTVGYAYGWMYDWTGWTDTEHSHEQGRWANCQSYSGKGMIKALDTNYAYAPADNWIVDVPGWQGIGPAFDFENCEQIRIRDGLLVADASSSNNLTRGGQFINCADTIIEANEIFLEGTWTGGNFWAVGGANTANVRIIDNMTVHYAAMSEWLFVNSNVNFRQVEERGNAFRGTGTYTAKINDLTQSISETRVKDIVEALGGSNWSWDVQADGCTVFRNSYSGNTDGTGNISITLPVGLFRTIRNVSATNGSTSVNSPVAIGSASTTTIPLRFTALGAITAVGVSIEVHGR
jgi:hypothetical protein